MSDVFFSSVFAIQNSGVWSSVVRAPGVLSFGMFFGRVLIMVCQLVSRHLTGLEDGCVAVRVPFMLILSCGIDTEVRLKDSLINVPVDGNEIGPGVSP